MLGTINIEQEQNMLAKNTKGRTKEQTKIDRVAVKPKRRYGTCSPINLEEALFAGYSQCGH